MVTGPTSQPEFMTEGGSWDESLAALGLDFHIKPECCTDMDEAQQKMAFLDPCHHHHHLHHRHPPDDTSSLHTAMSPSTSASSPCSISLAPDHFEAMGSLSLAYSLASMTDRPNPVSVSPLHDAAMDVVESATASSPSTLAPEPEREKDVDRRCWDKCVMEIHEHIARLETMIPIRDWRAGEGVTGLIVRLQSMARWMGQAGGGSSSDGATTRSKAAAAAAEAAKVAAECEKAGIFPLPVPTPSPIPPPPPFLHARSTSDPSACTQARTHLEPTVPPATLTRSMSLSSTCSALSISAVDGDVESLRETEPRNKRSMRGSKSRVQSETNLSAMKGAKGGGSGGGGEKKGERSGATQAAPAADDLDPKRRRTASFADLRKTCEKQLLWTLVKMLKEEIPGGFPFVNKDKTRLEDLRGVLASFNSPWGPMVAPHICQDRRTWKVKLALSSFARKLMEFLLTNKKVCGEYREIITTMGYISIGGHGADPLRGLYDKERWQLRLRDGFEVHMDSGVSFKLGCACGSKTPLETIFEEISATAAKLYHIKHFVLVLRIHGHPGFVFLARRAPSSHSPKGPLVRWLVSDHTGQHVVQVTDDYRAGHLMLEHCDTSIVLFVNENDAVKEVQRLCDAEQALEINVEKALWAPSATLPPRPIILTRACTAPAAAFAQHHMPVSVHVTELTPPAAAAAAAAQAHAMDLLVSGSTVFNSAPPDSEDVDGPELVISTATEEDMAAFSFVSLTSAHPGVLPDLPQMQHYHAHRPNPLSHAHTHPGTMHTSVHGAVAGLQHADEHARFSPISFFTHHGVHNFQPLGPQT